MKTPIIFILLCLGFYILHLDSYSQITRGADPGELYLSTDWYQDNYGDVHYAIFHSVDNGATITLQYKSSTASPPDEMGVGRVLGDATPGALYNYYGELWVSYDYGENWEFIENLSNTNYMVGHDGGTIFRRIGFELSQSTDFGTTFTIVTDPISCPIRESGYSLGEFYGINGNVGIGLYLDHTLDFANTFTEISIDSSVAFWAPGGIWPEISKGTVPGELYLVSWWLDSNYKIFHSVDTGYTWTQKYESDYIDLYFWRVHYTAGREPGSFYVMRSRINPVGDHVWLYIDYSSDYGETFTTYFHDLDSTLTSTESPEFNNIELFNYPNPFTDRTRISIASDKNLKDAYILICDVLGRQIQKIALKDKNSFIWDATDSNGKKVRNGLYFYYLIAGNTLISSNKLLINR